METGSGESLVDRSVYFCPICNNVVQETVNSYKAKSIRCDNYKLILVPLSMCENDKGRLDNCAKVDLS